MHWMQKEKREEASFEDLLGCKRRHKVFFWTKYRQRCLSVSRHWMHGKSMEKKIFCAISKDKSGDNWAFVLSRKSEMQRKKGHSSSNNGAFIRTRSKIRARKTETGLLDRIFGKESKKILIDTKTTNASLIWE